jgi:hypothetical protein
MKKILFTFVFVAIYFGVFSQHTLFFYIPECPHHTEIDETVFQKNGISVYPNPAIDIISIKFNSLNDINGDINAEIFDIHGKLKFKQNYSSLEDNKSIEIYLNDLNQGMYLIQISSSDKVLGKKRFIKTK